MKKYSIVEGTDYSYSSPILLNQHSLFNGSVIFLLEESQLANRPISQQAKKAHQFKSS